ncbi:DUF2637 domain-containing protein [Streptomyces sp. NPDC048430]|uniref:DUF2637 domain-containing protein n=1 Tax=Streptomyces sp. NPDC048430 TaxID=3155388 RepID=UPI00341B41C7
MQLTRAHRVLIGVVVAGAVLIAAIGFAGSYAAVRELAEEKGFGDFSVVFPIGIDAGICVLLALDLLLTWMRIPFPLLRQTAWLLTAATIAFNGAAAWPDPLGTGMHAVIPILFVVAVEAARHAVGRIADITADKHMEGVRLTRWLLSPVPTFKLWRRMKLWELRSYEQVIKLEQDRLIYQARLQARFGRNWRRKAPVESMMPLRLAKYGVPLAETAPAGLAAAGIEPALLPPAPAAVETERELVPAHAHARALDAGESFDRAGGDHDALPQEARANSFEAAEPELPMLPDVDYVEAVQGYITQYGTFPNARQFGLFLAEYAITDPATGGPLPEALLRPVLHEVKLAYPSLDDQEPAGEPDVTEHVNEPLDDDSTTPLPNTPAPDSSQAFMESAGPQHFEAPSTPLDAAPRIGAPVPAPTAEVTDEHRVGNEAPQQTSLNVPSARTPQPAPSEPGTWQSTATESGAATARLPEQQVDEVDLDPVQQQIVTVAGWLADAEEAGEKLSGAEVARRLSLSPKTGQRRVTAAAEYLQEQRRQQGRGHLRSVTS